MDKQEILTQLHKMATVEDLAELLDHIKREHELFGKIRYDISAKMLRHFSSDNIAPKRFRTFHISKKNGGKREIKAPCAQLDVILTCINEMLKAIYEPSDAAMGFAQGRSVVSNAQMHVGHNYVFNIDLENFFPSIPQPRVWKRLQLPPFNFSKPIANVLAGLCCTKDATSGVNVLPQGSPASPLITNAICDKLDHRMKGVAKRFGLHYSRYADDMTFSSMHNVYREGSDFRCEIQRLIEQQGFRMNEKKTRLQKRGTRQEVTGLTVNEVANVTRKYVRFLRWILHIWETKGYGEAYACFYPKYKYDKGYIKKGEPVMENVIGGKLNYLRMVKGVTNEAYRKLDARYAKLQQLQSADSRADKNKSFIYVWPYTMEQFKELFHTDITLEISRNNKVIGKCLVEGEIGGKPYERTTYLSLSDSTQKLLFPDSYALSEGTQLDSAKIKDCYVSLCRRKDKNFWLITNSRPKRSHCLSASNLKIDINILLDIWEKEGFEAAVGQFMIDVNDSYDPTTIAEIDDNQWDDGLKETKAKNYSEGDSNETPLIDKASEPRKDLKKRP